MNEIYLRWITDLLSTCWQIYLYLNYAIIWIWMFNLHYRRRLSFGFYGVSNECYWPSPPSLLMHPPSHLQIWHQRAYICTCPCKTLGSHNAREWHMPWKHRWGWSTVVAMYYWCPCASPIHWCLEFPVRWRWPDSSRNSPVAVLASHAGTVQLE